MIESITFKNFRALQRTTLPLGRFTLIVGPNGSGKTTAFQALEVLRRKDDYRFDQLVSVGTELGPDGKIEVLLHWGKPSPAVLRGRWPKPPGSPTLTWLREDGEGNMGASPRLQELQAEVNRIRVYSLDAKMIAQPVHLTPQVELSPNGLGLAGVFDRLRDLHHERFEQLNAELARFLPEFDRILFDVPNNGMRAFLLRTRQGHHRIPALDLSHGTLLALAILTLAYLPEPPPLICLEEPDRGIHPRLLRRVQDALYRLSHPESAGETRPPVQVVVTTQSPYFLDLFKDHPEEVVIAEKTGLEARFSRLTERGDIEDILSDASLGAVWYSGVLGGVPVNS